MHFVAEDLLKASELPSQVKEKIALERSFGVKHGVQLLRLKDKPDKQEEEKSWFLQFFSSFNEILVEEQKKGL